MADLVFNFQAYWNPTTNSPNLTTIGTSLNNTTDRCKLWVANAAGNSSITGSSLPYAIGEGVYWSGTAWLKATSAEIAPPSDSDIFVVPADFNWSGDLSSLANTECLISNVHNISANVNLPVGIKLTFSPGGKFTQVPLIKIPSFNLGDWTVTNGVDKGPGANSFTTKIAAGGRIQKSAVLVTGKMYQVRIQGTTTANSVNVLDSGSVVSFASKFTTGAFNLAGYVKYTGGSTVLTVRAVGIGQTDIELFEVYEYSDWAIISPAAYGSTDEKTFPIINTPKGNKAIQGFFLKGMFKSVSDLVVMSDFFTGDSYNDTFLDSFVRTKFWFDTSLIQTGRSSTSINTGIVDATWKNYKGLSEKCSVEGVDGVTISDFYTFATGDFSVKNVTIQNGRINICNMYDQGSQQGQLRPLRFQIENLVGTDFRIGNEYPHPAAESVLTTPTISNIRLVATSGRQNMINLFSVIDAVMKDIHFSYDVYVGGDIDKSGGQPLILSSSVNGYYINVNADKGDSGMMFWMYLPTNLQDDDSVDWINSHAMDFKGFKGNTIRGGKFINMYEEAWTCDSTDSKSLRVTMNRNRFKFKNIIDSQTAEIELIYEEPETGLKPEDVPSSLVNTIMTSITKGKFGKYSEILSAKHVIGDATWKKFIVKGSTDFFAGAIANDQYAVTYGFCNNIIEDITFVNCAVPILLGMYCFRNTVRNNRVEGGFQISDLEINQGNVRQLSYSAGRKRCYIAPSIDNVFEDNWFEGNGLQVIDAKNPNEWINHWINEDGISLDPNLSTDGELGTIIRNNTIINGTVRLQGTSNTVYQENTLINVREYIVDSTFKVNSNIIINEPNNDNLDILFSSIAGFNSMLIPVTSKGDASGYTRITLQLGAGTVTASISENASFYKNTAGEEPSSTKTISATGVDVFLYFKCFDGRADIIISNASNITHLGGTATAILRYNSDNSPEVIIQKCRFVPKSILNIKQTSVALSLRGNVGNLPEDLETLHVADGSSLLEGRIAEFPRFLNLIHLKYSMLTTAPSFKGDLADLPQNCTYFHDETKGGMYTYSTRTWPAKMHEVYFILSLRQWWTSDMVDQLLIDLSKTTWDPDKLKIINISSSARNPVPDEDADKEFLLPTRTAASDEAINCLIDKQVSVKINDDFQEKVDLP